MKAADEWFRAFSIFTQAGLALRDVQTLHVQYVTFLAAEEPISPSS